jgi:hypothetical protein
MNTSHTTRSAHTALSYASHAHPVEAPSLLLQDWADYVGTGWIVLWLHHGVFLLETRAGQILPNPALPEIQSLDLSAHLVRMRAFNAQCEWHIWRSNGGHRSRKRWEVPEAPTVSTTDAVDARLKLRGVIVRQLGDRMASETWLLHTRNYIGHDAFHMAGFVDSRFVGIERVKGGAA